MLIFDNEKKKKEEKKKNYSVVNIPIISKITQW